MKLLVFDTETTGKAEFRLPPEHPSQPHIVQLGAILYDDHTRVVAEVNLMVKPDGWTVPKEAADIHGITTERADQYGVAIKTVIMLFILLCRRAKISVAHNRAFDKLMVEIELIRLGLTKELEEFRAMEGFCTMEASTPICKLPGNYGRFKWPKLQEAHQHFFGKEFDGAHNAMADVRACAAVYFAMHPLPKVEVPA